MAVGGKFEGKKDVCLLIFVIIFNVDPLPGNPHVTLIGCSNNTVYVILRLDLPPLFLSLGSFLPYQRSMDYREW